MNYPHLPNAPIIEGLINIRVRPRPKLTLENLSPFRDKLRYSYPTVRDLQEIQAQVVISTDPNTPQPTPQPVPIPRVGYRFERASPNFVVHAKREELLVSRLRPYDTWESLLAEAKTIWALYCEFLNPEAITRLATRFINRVDLPLEGLDFDDYLAAPALIPKGLSQVFDHFMTRIVVPDAESGARVAIAQVLEPPNPRSGTLPILIDIDVFKEVDFAVDSDKPWELLAKMRNLKNRAFFDSVTEKTLELFR